MLPRHGSAVFMRAARGAMKTAFSVMLIAQIWRSRRDECAPRCRRRLMPPATPPAMLAPRHRAAPRGAMPPLTRSDTRPALLMSTTTPFRAEARHFLPSLLFASAVAIIIMLMFPLILIHMRRGEAEARVRRSSAVPQRERREEARKMHQRHEKVDAQAKCSKTSTPDHTAV